VAVRRKDPFDQFIGNEFGPLQLPREAGEYQDDTSKTGQIHSRRWHQRCQPRDEVQRLEDDVRGLR